tara:strand:+ start:13 stop:750 length:738 start_codon:yes stop_codon:yes gene_type:complete
MMKNKPKYSEFEKNLKAHYVSNMFSRIARKYDLLNTVISLGMHHQWRKYAIKSMENKNYVSSLDVACGTGDFSFSLSSVNSMETVVGLDFVKPMLQIAINKPIAQKKNNLSFILGDALVLPFKNKSFDTVTTGFAMRNYENAETAIKEMSRILKPNGSMIILDMLPNRNPNILQKFALWYFNKVIPILGAILARDREAYTYLPNSVAKFYDSSQIKNMMESKGMTNITIKKFGLGLVSLIIGSKN